MTAFELGVNYWPTRSAMYMWRELDLAEVRDELAHAASIGFDVVRLFVLLRDFVPGPPPLGVDSAMMERFVAVVREAKDAGLRVVPTAIVINMSGRMWWPEWMLRDGRPGCLYTEPTLLQAQSMLVEAICELLAGDEVVRAIDLTNEIDDAQRPPSRAAGRRWAAVLAEAARGRMPGVPVQIGVHLASLEDPTALRVDDMALVADEDLMHAYPLYCAAARSYLDPELVPFACALTAGLAGSGRAPLMQEFGLCTAPPNERGRAITDDFLGVPRAQYLASEAEGAAYYAAVLERLARTGAAGAYAWCYGDYDARLFGRPPLDTAVRERTFGLVRADGSEKPVCHAIRVFRQRRDAGTLARGPVPAVLDVEPDEYHRDPRAHFTRLYRRWTGEALT